MDARSALVVIALAVPAAAEGVVMYDQPLRFEVEDVELAWSRAREWVTSRIDERGHISISDYVIDVSGSESAAKKMLLGSFGTGKSFGVRVTLVGEDTIEVLPKSGDTRRAYYLARYIQTGDDSCLREKRYVCFTYRGEQRER